jgi:NAD(P)-dependent dehydrogenase (short-subunit alcohol dehydrogenase family)
MRRASSVDLHLEGKTAVVTGASKGIGLAIVAALVEAGAHVIAGARTRTPELQEFESAGKATFVEVDLATTDQPAKLIEAAAARGGLDILINNVGAAVVRPGGFASVTDDDWNAAWNLGVMSTVRTTRAAIPELLKRDKAAIVVVSSVNAFLPDPVLPDYCATKAALTNLTKGLSKELGPRGSGSTRSVRDQSRRPCGSATAASPRASPRPPGRRRRTSSTPCPPVLPWGASPNRMRWPTWWCSSPATAPRTSPEPI